MRSRFKEGGIVRYTATLVALVGAIVVSTSTALAESWYVPMGEQIVGGFDHLQARTGLTPGFDMPAVSLFWAYEAPDDVDLLASQWSQQYWNPIFTSASGPSIGDYLLVFDYWLDGAPPVGTVIYFQAYLGDDRVDNANLTYVGPDHEDWEVTDGTWTLDEPLTIAVCYPGDGNMDLKVDGADLAIWQRYYDPLGVNDDNWCATGDWNNDDRVDGADLALWQQNYAPLGYGSVSSEMQSGIATVPEPATLGLLAVGIAAGLIRRRGRTPA